MRASLLAVALTLSLVGCHQVKPGYDVVTGARTQAAELIEQEIRGVYAVTICASTSEEFWYRNRVCQTNGWVAVNYRGAVFPPGMLCQIYAKGPALHQIMAQINSTTAVTPISSTATATPRVTVKTGQKTMIKAKTKDTVAPTIKSSGDALGKPGFLNKLLLKVWR